MTGFSQVSRDQRLTAYLLIAESVRIRDTIISGPEGPIVRPGGLPGGDTFLLLFHSECRGGMSQDGKARGVPLGDCLGLWGSVEAPVSLTAARSRASGGGKLLGINKSSRWHPPPAGVACNMSQAAYLSPSRFKRYQLGLQHTTGIAAIFTLLWLCSICRCTSCSNPWPQASVEAFACSCCLACQHVHIGYLTWQMIPAGLLAYLGQSASHDRTECASTSRT